VVNTILTMKELNFSYTNRRIFEDIKERKKYKVPSKQCKTGLTGVYVIVNKDIKAVYVGQSINLNGRIKNHKSLLNQGKHSISELQKDYEAFKEGFEFKIIEHSEDDTDLLKLETQNISDYKRKGYKLYNTIHDTENPLAHMVICQQKEHQKILERINKLLKTGKITIAQLDYSIEYIESQF